MLALNRTSESLTRRVYKEGWRVAIKIGQRIYEGKPGGDTAVMMGRDILSFSGVVTGSVVHGKWVY